MRPNSLLVSFILSSTTVTTNGFRSTSSFIHSQQPIPSNFQKKTSSSLTAFCPRITGNNNVYRRHLPELSAKKSKDEEETGIQKKLIAESIAPWRALRLFIYAGLGSGATLGGFITLSGVAAALSGARTDVDLNTEYVNLAIDFGAAIAFAVIAKFDLDKGAELSEKVDEKFKQKSDAKQTKQKMERRARDLADLKLSIRVSEEGSQEARVQDLQRGAKQHMIVVAGPRKAIRDALLGANLMKLSDFAMNNVLVVPYELGVGTQDTASAGFGERPDWETKPYVARPVGEGWEEYIDEEMKDAVAQSGEDAKKQGIAVVVANNGKVIRRGVGTVPWRKMVDELTGKEEEEEEFEMPFVTD